MPRVSDGIVIPGGRKARVATMPGAVSTSTVPSQMASWVMPTKQMPSSLPIISSKGVMAEISTSITRVPFSSSTPVITCWPHIRMLI